MDKTNIRRMCAALMIVLACDGVLPPDDPVFSRVVPRPSAPLGGDLRSGLTLAATKSLASLRKCTWQVHEVYRRLPDAPGALEKFETKATSPACNHLGVTGSMELAFVNDSLMEVRFVPDDLAAYLHAAEQEVGERMEVGKDPYYEVGRSTSMHVFTREDRVVAFWVDSDIGIWLLSAM